MIYGWANDLREVSGEGLLGLTFMKEISLIYKDIFLIKTNQNIFYFKEGKKIKEIKSEEIFKYGSFFEKYLSNLIGIFYLLRRNKDKEKIIYVNYLPLWNWLIFLLLPKQTILGPITGGSLIQELSSFKVVIRKIIFPIFFKISSNIIKKKFQNIIFSTSLLKKYFNSKNNYFDFVIFYLKYIELKRVKKDIDLIYYNRDHPNKNNYNIKKLVVELARKKKVHIFGNNLDSKNIVNHGYISKNKKSLLLSRSKYAIISSENFLSLFTLECFKNNIKIISNVQKPKVFYNNRNFIKINLVSYEKTKKNIIYMMNKKYKFINSKTDKILRYKVNQWNLFKLHFIKRINENNYKRDIKCRNMVCQS